MIEILYNLWGIIGIIIIFLILGHYLISVLIYIQQHAVFNHFVKNRPATYPETPDDFWLEQKRLMFKSQYRPLAPYFHWQGKEFHSKYINVDSDGLRRTIKSPKAGAKKVFVFGGAGVWGTFVPDSQTIPSYLQSFLGQDYDVYNSTSGGGHSSTQELNFLLYNLALGNVPDIVIFYEGIVDSYAGTFDPAIPRFPRGVKGQIPEVKIANTNFLSDLYNESNYPSLVRYIFTRFNFNFRDNEIKSNIDKNAQQVVSFYEAHIKQVKALGKEYGFQAFFFWQPNLLSLTKKYSPYEKRLVEGYSDTLIKSQNQVYTYAKEQFSNRESENIYFAGNIYDDVGDPIYFSWDHFCANANIVATKEIYEHIKEQI